MFGAFTTGVGRIVDLVGALSATALFGVFVLGFLVCYFLPESTASAYTVLFFGIIAGMRIYADTGSWVWTILAFVVAGGVFTFVSFIGNVRRGTVQDGWIPDRPTDTATEELLRREWTEYSSPQHKFIVGLPATPHVSEKSGEAIFTTTYSAGYDAGDLRVVVQDYPRGMIEDVGGPRMFFADWRATFDSWPYGVISFDDSSEFLGNPAARASLRSDDGTTLLMFLKILANGRAYTLCAKCFDQLSGHSGHDLFQRFVESFQFVDES